MIIIPHEQLTKQIPAPNRIFSNRAEKDFHPLLERTKYRLLFPKPFMLKFQIKAF